MRTDSFWKAVCLGLPLGVGLAIGQASALPTAPALARATDLPFIQPGTWQAELGGFDRLSDLVAFDKDDIWAAGDGIVHFDGRAWRQTIEGLRPRFQAIAGLSAAQLWAVGLVDPERPNDPLAAASSCHLVSVIYRRDGASWRMEPVEVHDRIFDLVILSPTEGWAVGGFDQAVILRYDGQRWTAAPAPEESAGLLAISDSGGGDLWAVGRRGAVVHLENGVWRAKDGPSFVDLTAIDMLSRDYGLAVGYERDTHTGVALAFRSGSWRLDMLGRSPALTAVQVLSPDFAIAVGQHGVLVHHDGKEWKEFGRSNPGDIAPRLLSGAADGAECRPPQMLASLQTPSAETGEAAASLDSSAAPWDPWETENMLRALVPLDQEHFIAVGDFGQVIQISDSLRWTELHAAREWAAIDMLDNSYGWVLGKSGAPLRYADGAWSIPASVANGEWLTALDVVARDNVWAVGRYGTVAHWNGQEWKLLAQFTWLDLTAVAFADADHGWAVAAGGNRDSDSVPVAFVFAWDGRTWRQVLRLCDVALTDIETVSATDVWFAGGGGQRQAMLHFDGQGWVWHPIHGYDAPASTAARVTLLARSPGGRLWAGGSGFAWLDTGVWKSRRSDFNLYAERLGGATEAGVWLLSSDYSWHSSSSRRQYSQAVSFFDPTRKPVHLPTLSGSFNDLAAIVNDEGGMDIWMVGAGGTVVRYRTPSQEVLLPQASPTPAFPAVVLVPSPTPFSLITRAQAMEHLLGIVDPEKTGTAKVDSLTLISIYEMDRFERAYAATSVGGGFSWSGRSGSDSGPSLDPCKGAQAVWMAVLSHSPVCAHRHLVFLNIASDGSQAFDLSCSPQRQGTLYLPLLVQYIKPGGEAATPTATRSLTARNLTPQPVSDTSGACPTRTPYPEAFPYPGP